MCPSLPPLLDDFPRHYWLVAPGRAQVQRDVGLSLKNFMTYFTTDSSPWLWNSFARPVEDAHRRQTYRGRCNAKLTTLEQLPNELLDIIITFLSEEKRDILALGLSSACMWPVVLDYIHAEYRNTAASWAGTEIAFLGMNSEKVRETLQGTTVNRLFTPPFSETYFSRHNNVEALAGVPLSAMDVDNVGQPGEMRICGIRVNDVRPLDLDWLHVLRSAKHWRGFRSSDWTRIGQDLSASYLFPQDRVWVLRNLTTLEYVRSDQLSPTTLEKQKPKQSFISRMSILKIANTLGLAKWSGAGSSSTGKALGDRSPVTFGQILLLQTSFSQSISLFERMLKFCPGWWSGQCFDVVSLDHHTAASETAEWKNVSQAVVSDVVNLRHWIDQFGIEGIKAMIYPGTLPRKYDDVPERLFRERQKYHSWREQYNKEGDMRTAI